jgi:hypothetical protein
MTKEEAEFSAAVFKRCSWDVDIDCEIGIYMLKGKCKHNGYVLAQNHNDMKALVLAGQVRTLK